MNSRKKSYRIKIILSLSNINADFLQLILCMMVSHFLLDNPMYGAALFLFSNIWILYFQSNLRHLTKKTPHSSGTNVAMWILLALSVVAGLVLIFFYPIVMRSLRANLVSFFVLLLAARMILTHWVNTTFNKPRMSHRWYKVLFQLLFLVPVGFYVFALMDGVTAWVILAGAALTGFLVSYQSSTMASFGKYVRNTRPGKLEDIFSYRVFSNTALYSQIAFSLGVLMYICYICFYRVGYATTSYILMGVWLLIVLFSSELFTWIVNRNGKWLSLNLFLVGAALWILSSFMIYDVSGILSSGLWTMLWGFGLACITSVLNRYNMDFKLVARIADRKVTDRDLYFRSLLTQVIAVIISNTIMLFVLTFVAFVVPTFKNAVLPAPLREIMIQVPVLFMIVSVFFALRQPLDARSRQKLENFYKSPNSNKPTKQNLNKSLVEKGKVRFGVKILAFIVKPFLRLKVFGRENMEMENFPSIFVCNHGIFYGPIAAVIYLPTYFRPWIDRKMVDMNLTPKEIYDREMYRVPLISYKTKMWLSTQLARPVTWALNSFNPIPVEKTSLRNVMKTFDDTVQVLGEGDNVLIFPEKPRKVKKGNKMTVQHNTKTVGSLYTGFANIGKLYYDKTGKPLRFYPIYANKDNHTFQIGKPVIFNPDNDPREEKQRIADTLHDKMMFLQQNNPREDVG